jgi:hypothetical protein
MANNFVFADWVAAETLRTLINKAQIAPFFNTSYNKEFQQSFAIGDTVRVKLPQRFLITDGLAYQEQPIDRRYVTVTIDQPFGVHFGWDDIEAALKLERPNAAIRKEYIVPAAEQLQAELDSRCSLWAKNNTNNLTGVLGVTPTAPQTYGHARTILNQNSAPTGHRGLILTPTMEETISANTLVNFNPQADISKLWKEGSLGKFQGFDTYESNQLYPHTAGTWAAAVTINGGGQSGSSIQITCTAGDTFNIGDIVNVTLMNNVNPVTRRSVGSLKQLVVTAPMVGVGAGNAADALQISPAIEGPGSQYQNVDSLPGGGAALTLFPGTASPNGKSGFQGIGLTDNAFALVGVKLETPNSQEMASQMRDPATGLSVRFVRSWDQQSSSMRNRLEMCVGFGNLYPDQCSVRVQSLA